MDMDLKPAGSPANPNDIIKPGMPSGPPSDDPFKHDAGPSKLPSQPKPMKSGGGAGKKVMMVLLVLVLLGAVGYGVFYWQHKHVTALINQRADLQKQITDLQTQNASAKADAEKAVAAKPSTDQLVITAVTDYCQAGVDPTTKKALVVTENTQKKVMYSASDKNYATTQAACTAAASTNAADMKTYYLRYSGSTWVVLYAATAPDANMTKQYNIPNDFK